MKLISLFLEKKKRSPLDKSNFIKHFSEICLLNPNEIDKSRDNCHFFDEIKISLLLKVYIGENE